MARRLVLAAQFWEGDKEATMRNARRIADIEPEFRKDVEFCFVARFDCEHDKATIDYVSKKFKVSTYTGRRRGTGWPHGCNELWCDLMQAASCKYLEDWQDVKAIFTFESDCIPIAKDWIDVMSAEWDRGEKQGAQVVGCWLQYWGGEHGHINGNALFHPFIARTLTLIGCTPLGGWDAEFAPRFQSCWYKSGFIKNLYRAVNVSDSDIVAEWIPGERPVAIHGVKDLSVEKYADRVLLGRE